MQAPDATEAEEDLGVEWNRAIRHRAAQIDGEDFLRRLRAV